MLYLLIQTWIWILAAGLFGLFIGWLIWGRRVRDSVRSQAEQGLAPDKGLDSSIEKSERKQESDVLNAERIESTARYQQRPSTATIFDDGSGVEEKPGTLSTPQGQPDDLKRIKGIGPVIERKLNDLGIYHFHQIAAFNDENIRWIDNNVAFPGRVNREQWVSQAKLLEMGVSTEFSDRYDAE